MGNESLEYFKSTLNMPELSELEIGSTSQITTFSTYLRLFDGIRLKEDLDVINFFLDNMPIRDAYIWLSRKKIDPDFIMRLTYAGKDRPFTADLNPPSDKPERYKMNYPKDFLIYSEWQSKLRELLAELKLYSPKA